MNRLFTITEVRKAVLKSKNKKAAGIDGLIYEALKNETTIRTLTELFNKCLSTGLLPSMWLKGVIKPIPKSHKSDPRVPLNCQEISLLPTIGKVYSGLLGARIGRHLESKELLVEEQNGFRPNRSCVNHIFTLYDLLRIQKGNNETFCAVINFQKAFDMVNHEFLLHKLWETGVCGRAYDSVKAIYSSSTSCVNVNGRLTGWFPVRSGV